jgi:iron complex transport system substrate-binding protein
MVFWGPRSSVVWLLVLAGLFGCDPPPQAHVGTAKRVVSLTPSTTEALAAIGARDALVGRSRYCDFPPDVLRLPVVGGYVDPSYEAILALTPDLVIGARGPAGPDISTRLASRGIDTYFPVTESFAGIDDMLLGLGERTGHVEGARRLVSRLHEEEAAISKAVSRAPRVRVLLLFGLSPIVAAGPGGFPAEMLDRAGAVNVVTEGGAYPTLGLEHVLALDPDIIVDAAWGEATDRGRVGPGSSGWKELRAVKDGRVVRLEDEAILRPGPRIADGLKKLAHALHPEVPLP